MDHQQEIQQERTTVTKTTKSVRVVQHSSESVESSSEFGSHEGSPLSSRKEIRHVSQIQKTLQNCGSDDFMLQPLRSLGERFCGKEADFEDVSTQISTLHKQETFEVKLDVTEYAPEDIQVKVLDDVVVITGKQEIRINENNFRSRSFSKKFSIPQGVTPETIKCILGKDGTLKITAPWDQQQQCQVTRREISNTSVTSNVSNESNNTQSDTDGSPVITPIKINSNLQGLELGTFVDSKTFTVRVAVNQFVAEEIKVKVTSSLITVEGKHESEFASRSFYKEFTLVSGVEVNKMQCTLSTDGILTIQAPIDPKAQKPNVSQTETQMTQQHQKVTQQQQDVTREQQEVTRQQAVTQQQEVTEQRQEIRQQEVTQQRQEVTQQQQQVTQQKQEVTTLHDIRQPSPPKGVEPQAPPRSGKPQTPRSGSPAQPPASTNQTPAHPTPTNQTPAHPTPSNQGPGRDSPTQNKPNASSKSPEAPRAGMIPVQSLPNAEPRVTSPDDQGPNELCQVNDGKTLKVRVNVTEYTREELRVTIVNRMIVIEGNHEDSLSSRSFLKKVPIPSGVEPDQIASGVTPNGVLVVTAPVTPGRGSPPKDTKSTPAPLDSKSIPRDSKSPTKDSKSPPKDSKSPVRDTSVTSVNSRDTSVEQRKTTKTTEETFEEDDFVIVPTGEPSPPQSPDAEDDEAPKELSNVLSEDKYELVLDASKYKREEIIVKVSRTTIRIEGKQTKEFSSRSFVKENPIPDGVEPNSIKSSFTPDGRLVVTAPVTKPKGQSPAGTGQGQPPSAPAPAHVPKELIHKIDQEYSVVDVKETTTEKKENTLQKSSSDEKTNQVAVVNDGKNFKVTIDVKEYRREEITIRVTKSVIRIEGKQERKLATKSFFKEVPIPAGVDPKSIVSNITQDGLLIITATVTETRTQTQTTQENITQQKKSVTEEQRIKESQLINTQTQQNLQQTNQTSVQQKSTNSQQTTSLKTTFDLNAAKETIDGAVRDLDMNEKTFTMVYNVSGYGPEDISIRITKYVVTVEGKQSTEFSSRSFVKKFSIPHGVNPQDFNPTLTAEGVLTFTAPIDHSRPITA